MELSAGGLRRRCWPLGAALLSLLDPALAPAGSREAAPAEASDGSEEGLERGDAPVRFDGKLLESLVEGADEPELDGGALPLPPGAPGGAFWAKALVAAPPTARAATAQSVVILRMWESPSIAPPAI